MTKEEVFTVLSKVEFARSVNEPRGITLAHSEIDWGLAWKELYDVIKEYHDSLGDTNAPQTTTEE